MWSTIQVNICQKFNTKLMIWECLKNQNQLPIGITLRIISALYDLWTSVLVLIEFYDATPFGKCFRESTKRKSEESVIPGIRPHYHLEYCRLNISPDDVRCVYTMLLVSSNFLWFYCQLFSRIIVLGVIV